MSGVDERVVRMRFDNAQFKKAAGETQTQLDTLDKSVANAGKGRGLLDMGKQMDQVSVKASGMQVAVVTAIANITNRAVNAGINMAKSLTLDPIKAGFDEYELKMKSIQTILANTKGETLKTVTTRLNELNEYSDKTIYNFGNMTDAIGKLTTAGIGLDEATGIVKGFSNMVALSGGDATAAAGAMEQFNQGLQAGVIRAMDWQSLATRGLGSQALQKAFFETARAAGTLKDVPLSTTFEEWTKANGGFKGSLEQNWLTADVASQALRNMTGDVKSVKELVAQGFDPKIAKDMLDIANNAFDSATKVRTFTNFMGTLKEQLGSGWSQVFEVIIGDFNEASNLFSSLSDVTGKALGNFFDYITALLKGWDKMGGRAAILQTIQNLLAPIGAILSVISKAWKAAFPSKEAGSGLAAVSKGLELITRPLQILADLIEGSVGPITAFFQILKIGKTAAKEFGEFIGDAVEKLLGLAELKAPSGGGGFIQFIKDIGREIGDALQQISDLIDKGESLKEAFGKVDINLPNLPNLPSLPSLPSFGGGGGAAGGVSGAVTGKLGLLTAGFKDLTGSVETFSSADQDLAKGFTFNPDATLDTSRMRDVGNQFEETGQKAETLGDKVGPALDGIKDRIGKFFSGEFNFDDLMASFNLAVLSTFVISISRMFNTMSKSFEGFMGVGEGINGILNSAGDALKSFQTAARAKLIIAIAIAIGILALSLWLLSRIPADKLGVALGALAGLALILKVTLDTFTKTVESMNKKGMNGKMLALGLSMVLFAGAILLLAIAMKKLNGVDWDSAVMAAGAMILLVKAMEKISEMPSDGIVKTAFALVVVSAGLLLFAEAIKKFAKLDLGTFAEGMTYAAISLASLVFILHGFESSLAGAAAMVVAVAALWLLVDVIEKFAKLDWGTFGKGMLFIGASLVVLVVALYGFTSSLAGAAALLVVVAALWVLVGVIQAFAKLDWGTFFKGLAMLAIAMVTLGALMALMGLLSPLILLGAAALLIFGAAMLMLGLGIKALAAGMIALMTITGGFVAAISGLAVGLAIGFGVFLQTLALQAPIMKDSFLKILKALLDTIVEAVPMIIDAVKRLWSAVMKELGGGDKGTAGGGAKGVAMQATGKSWLEKLGDGIKKMLPKIVDLAVDLFTRFVEGVSRNAGKLATAGVNLIVKLIEGISSKIGDIVNAAVNLIIEFQKGIANGLTRIVNAGIDLIAQFLHDLADAIRRGSKAIGGGLTDVVDAMKDVGMDLVHGLIDGVAEMAQDAINAIGDLAGKMVGKAKDILDIFSPSRVFRSIGKFLVQGLTKGIQDHAASAIIAVASLVGGQIAVASEYINKFIQDLDQKAIAASAKAAGLQAAAERAAKAAEKTEKNKKDDKSAAKLQDRADKATKKAEQAENRAEKQKAKAERAEQFENATLLEKAQMRSEDAQNQIDAAKEAEFRAASKLAEARALREQAKAKGVSKKDAKEMRKRAAELEKQAEAQARQANEQIRLARLSAADALALQKLAGDEAAKLFEERFKAEAQADAEEEAFNKLTDADKAVVRRSQAAALQAKANADLQKAKELAYTDLEAANELAEEALAQAEQARAYLVEAQNLENQASQGSGQTPGTVVNLDPTEAASIAFGDFASIYDDAFAAASRGNPIEFNQYNTSPEALNPTDVYRQTNNQLAFAADKLQPGN